MVMNTLFNELRLDAGISRLDDNFRLVVIGKDGNVTDPLLGLEKFALLVIQECIETLEESAEDIDNGNIFHDKELLNKFEERWSAGLYYAIEKIEERFCK
jgi:hypothetical protein